MDINELMVGNKFIPGYEKLYSIDENAKLLKWCTKKKLK